METFVVKVKWTDIVYICRLRDHQQSKSKGGDILSSTLMSIQTTYGL